MEQIEAIPALATGITRIKLAVSGSEAYTNKCYLPQIFAGELSFAIISHLSSSK